MPYAEPGTFLFLRFALAFALLAVISMLVQARWPARRDAMMSVLVGVLVHGIYLGGVFWAIRHGMPAGVAAIVVGLQPLLTALLAGWWLGENIATRHRVGVALGLVGVVLVLAPRLDIAGSGITAVTVAAALLATVAITVGTVIQKRFATASDLRSGTALQYLGALLPVGLLMMFETRTIEWTGQLIFSLAWLVVVLSLAAVFLLMWLIQQGSVAKVSTLFFLVPSVASVIAWLLFGETLNPLQLAGMALTAVAVWLASSTGLSPAARARV